jgi:predicted nucleic acid-binding protein
MNLIPGNKYLFDTTVFLDLLREREVGRRLHYQARFLRVFVGYSIVTETELWMGIRGLRSEGQHIEILKPYTRYFVNVTIARDAGRFWEELRNKDNLQGKNLPDVGDCLIAATARFYRLRLVSKNTRHMPKFEKFGVVVDLYEDED